MAQDRMPPLVSGVLGDLLKITGEGMTLLRPRSAGSPPEILGTLGSGNSDVVASAGTVLRAALRGVQFGLSAAGRPVLAAPVRPEDGETMVIALWRGPGGKPWSANDYLLATAIAVVIRSLLSHTDTAAERNDLFDPLTRLPARGWFEAELSRRIERADRDNDVSTLMLVDIDHLKRLNDSAGRAEGDRLLLRAAAGLRRVTRPSDLLARIGGDEFALWLNGMDHLAAAERAENIRRDLLAPEPDEEINHRLTVTIGIATRWPGRDESAESLAARAEAVMRRVKAEGGAAWRVAPDPPARR